MRSSLPTRRQAFIQLLKDLGDSSIREAYWYAVIWQLPGLFGNLVRARFIGPRLKKAGVNLHVMAGTRLSSLENLDVGNHVSIGYDNDIDARGGVTLGDYVTTAPGVQIISELEASAVHGSHETGADISGEVRIDADVLLASNVIVLPGVHLPRGCIVSAASVVEPKVYRPYSILAGNPARVIGFRGSDGRNDERHTA